jgi:hypothetical protein
MNIKEVFYREGYQIPFTRPWRVGRSLGRTLYIQLYDDASKGDLFVGTMDTRELADYVVTAVNRYENSHDLFAGVTRIQEMIAELDVALHGATVARDSTPEEVWNALLFKVGKLTVERDQYRELIRNARRELQAMSLENKA